MTKPYIFGHRGAMGYEIENTIPSFKRAVEMSAGIETDVHLTKDNILVCFHDPSFDIDSKNYIIKNLTFENLREIQFQDNRIIPTVEEVFQTFKKSPKTLRYSCDIGNRKTGFELLKLVEKYSMYDCLEITDQKPRLLQKLRETNKNIRLVHTVPHFVSIINQQTVHYDTLLEHGIKILNIKFDRLKKNFKTIIDNGFKCYTWGINTKPWMKKALQLTYKNEGISAIYTNYPDALVELRDQYYG